jgi:O-acetyl-ADP-ribose deacetylase (regulator of RNase III)
MTITTVNKDLFTMSQGYYLAHCISADFALGAGIAKAFDSVYNMKFKLYRHYDNYVYRGGDALLIDNVFNLVTKAKCWQKPTYESLRESLEMMREQLEFMNVTKLAIPMLGCGLDRLQWMQVESIIKDVFADTDVDIVVCVLE